MNRHIAYIGLGSNIGERAETLIKALEMLNAAPGIRVLKASQMIQTEPVGGPPHQPKFINAAAELETSLAPEQLLAALHKVEALLGRNRAQETPSGPRTCDLDILLFDDLVLDSDHLRIPHPQMHERLFVLRPLAGIAGDVVHPTLHKTISQLLADVEASQ